MDILWSEVRRVIVFIYSLLVSCQRKEIVEDRKKEKKRKKRLQMELLYSDTLSLRGFTLFFYWR